MEATLGTRVGFEFLFEVVQQRTAEGKHTEVPLEGGIAKVGFRQRKGWNAVEITSAAPARDKIA